MSNLMSNLMSIPISTLRVHFTPLTRRFFATLDFLVWRYQRDGVTSVTNEVSLTNLTGVSTLSSGSTGSAPRKFTAVSSPQLLKLIQLAQTVLLAQ